MQEAAGIIAEYNPFHNGHLHHLREARQTGLPIIAVMSGSIMQRGEPAFLDKWTRARLAVQSGVDLVFELPCAFSLRSAQFFAAGAVSLLEATGCVRCLACGAEHPEYDFTALAGTAASPAYRSLLRELLRAGRSYAAASAEALTRLGAAPTPLELPNDILALEYAKALLHTGIRPLFIRRREAAYNDSGINGGVASARAIRAAISEGRASEAKACVPPPVWEELSRGCGYDVPLLWNFISYRLRMLTPAEIAAGCQCSEGLENLLQQAAGCASLEEALRLCATKRYPAARLRRLFLQLLLHRERSCFEQERPAYLRLLAFSNTGRALLQNIKAHGSLPIISKLGHDPCKGQSSAFKQQLELDLAAADLLSLLQHRPPKSDFFTSPCYEAE